MSRKAISRYLITLSQYLKHNIDLIFYFLHPDYHLEGEDLSTRLVSHVELTSDAVNWLSRTFPAISELRLVLDGFAPLILDQVMSLLENYSVRLSILKMWTCFVEEENLEQDGTCACYNVSTSILYCLD